MASIPKTMRSLAATKYCEPAGYEVIELPVPEIREPDQVLVKVHAGGISTGDTQIVGGDMRIIASVKLKLPRRARQLVESVG